MLNNAKEELIALLSAEWCQDAMPEDIAEVLCNMASDVVAILTPLLGELDLETDNDNYNNEDE